MTATVVRSVNDIVKIGSEKYSTYVQKGFVDRYKQITGPIMKTKLSLFSLKPTHTPKQKGHMNALKSDCELFSKLNIPYSTTDGKLVDFSSMKISHTHIHSQSLVI